MLLKMKPIGNRQGFLRALALATGGFLLGFCLNATADEIYRWVDESGVVNYTQQKPRGTDVETIATDSGGPRVVEEPITPPLQSSATGQPLNEEQQKMLEGLQAEERNRQNEIARIKEQNCQQSRDVLSRLTIKSRIRIKGEDGEYTVMGEDERQDRIAEAQEGIALYCASA
jgi:hypothetical protein